MDEETKQYLNSTHDEDVMLKSPQGSTTSLLADDPLISTGVGSLPPKNQISPPRDAQQKKIVLKRKSNSSFSLGENNEKSSPTEEAPAEKIQKTSAITAPSATTVLKPTTMTNTEPEDDDKKVVKLAELTMKERLELRAKKFGAPLSGDAMKSARAERFGIQEPQKNASDSGSITASPVTASVDVLKKRAERFGGSVSKAMTSIENKEKLQKRQERFGSAVTQADKSALEEKAKLRLERFKTTVN